MITERLARLRQTTAGLFPERHLYVRSGGEMRKFVLSPKKQGICAGVGAAVAVWCVLATGGIMVNAVQLTLKDQAVARERARVARVVADRQAKLVAMERELDAAEGGVSRLAQSVESRHHALEMVVAELQGRTAPAPRKTVSPVGADPATRVQSVRADQDRLLEQAERLARTRAERLKQAFRTAGLNPSTFASRNRAQGGPLMEVRDAKQMANLLGVDEGFAARIQRASISLAEARALTEAADDLPFAKPTGQGYRTSSFGVRFDPFTSKPAFHSGVDFGGALMTPVVSTGPGVVSFAGQRSGYGNAVEVDHGFGLKTRYAHLAQIGVRPGQSIVTGQRLGGMGSTGRSTGVHLHYEVWMNGRVQNPDRFLRAGQHVPQAN